MRTRLESSFSRTPSRRFWISAQYGGADHHHDHNHAQPGKNSLPEDGGADGEYDDRLGVRRGEAGAEDFDEEMEEFCRWEILEVVGSKWFVDERVETGVTPDLTDITEA